MSRLIDADELERDMQNEWERNEISNGDWIAFREILNSQPTVSPKQGRWISDRLVTTSGGTYGVRRCSLCEAYYQDVGYGWHYCPNCGARMEEVAK